MKLRQYISERERSFQKSQSPSVERTRLWSFWNKLLPLLRLAKIRKLFVSRLNLARRCSKQMKRSFCFFFFFLQLVTTGSVRDILILSRGFRFIYTNATADAFANVEDEEEHFADKWSRLRRIITRILHTHTSARTERRSSRSRSADQQHAVESRLRNHRVSIMLGEPNNY